MKTFVFVLFNALLICMTQNAAAEVGESDPGPSMLVESEQLQAKLGEPKLRILDVRSEDDYAKGHVPGAVRVDVGDWKKLAVAEGGLHDVKGWAAKIGSAGIGNGSQVVVYGGKISDAARIWWLLKYVGVENAAILNGGWEAWGGEDRPVQRATPEVKPAKFSPVFQADRLAEIDSVKKSLKTGDLKVVDTRSEGEFADGRIPAAVHLEWKHLLADDGRFKTAPQLKELFRKQGILPAETAVCY